MISKKKKVCYVALFIVLFMLILPNLTKGGWVEITEDIYIGDWLKENGYAGGRYYTSNKKCKGRTLGTYVKGRTLMAASEKERMLTGEEITRLKQRLLLWFSSS